MYQYDAFELSFNYVLSQKCHVFCNCLFYTAFTLSLSPNQAHLILVYLAPESKIVPSLIHSPTVLSVPVTLSPISFLV